MWWRRTILLRGLQSWVCYHEDKHWEANKGGGNVHLTKSPTSNVQAQVENQKLEFPKKYHKGNGLLSQGKL